MILLIVAAVLCGLAFLPLGFRAVYRESDPGVWLLIGFLKFRVYPKKKKDGKSQGKKKEKSGEKTEKGGSYQIFRPIFGTVMEFLGHFRRKIRVGHLELRVTLAGDDPSDLAVNYGRAWAAVGSLMPQLERLFVIKKRNVEVQCDFTGDKTRIYARLDATITVGRTIHLLSRHGIKIIKHLLKMKKIQEGGAEI